MQNHQVHVPKRKRNALSGLQRHGSTILKEDDHCRHLRIPFIMSYWIWIFYVMHQVRVQDNRLWWVILESQSLITNNTPFTPCPALSPIIPCRSASFHRSQSLQSTLQTESFMLPEDPTCLAHGSFIFFSGTCYNNESAQSTILQDLTHMLDLPEFSENVPLGSHRLLFL